MRYTGQQDTIDNQAPPAIGVLLTNLGTPDAPTPKALRRYLKQFLSDPRVVELPRILWWAILNLIILPFRAKKSAALYKRIWTPLGSPLLAITQQQTQALQQKLDRTFGTDVIPVKMGMRYGSPSIDTAIASLNALNVQTIIVLPLYPQYCSATTGATFDAISHALTRYRRVPTLTFINGYHQHPSYIAALCGSITHHIAQHGMPERFVFSYHGIPERCVKQGDPYFNFCHQTSQLITEQLKLDPRCVITTFQSRFGKATWLQPYTDITLSSLPQQGIKQVALLCPGFSSDCLETLEEIDQENRERFIEAGGEVFHYIPCLNNDASHIEMMASVIQQYIPGKNRK